jgi:uncharacterized protein YbjQ (UPF0145 family)
MYGATDHMCCTCGRKEKQIGLDRVLLKESDGQFYCEECLTAKGHESDPAWHCLTCSVQFASVSAGNGSTSIGKASLMEQQPLCVSLGGKRYCKTCASKLVARVILTTTPSVEGYVVEAYFGLESVEFVMGSGLFTEVGGEWADFWGVRSHGFESKLHDAKTTAVRLLKVAALNRGGNAVIGVDMDYAEFSGNRVALILNGTVVRVRRKSATSSPTDD